jgi:MurNAc alpha-1-phosphate uridylyltransferase
VTARAHGLARVETAMVMAAGLGTRMRPLTDDRPKALVEVAGRPLVDHLLDRLAGDGVGRAVVNVHHFAERMQAHLKPRTAPRVQISDERGQLLETGGGLVKAAPILGTAPIFVVNIDSLWREDPGTPPALAGLRAAWDGERMDMVLLLARMDRLLGFYGAGDFHLEPDGRLRRRGSDPSAPFAFMGVQIIDPAILVGRTVEPFSTNRLWDEALARGRLHGTVLRGEWMHVGDPEAVAAAEARLAKAGA